MTKELPVTSFTYCFSINWRQQIGRVKSDKVLTKLSTQRKKILFFFAKY
jgi:hypothetical protein